MALYKFQEYGIIIYAAINIKSLETNVTSIRKNLLFNRHCYENKKTTHIWENMFTNHIPDLKQFVSRS